MFRSARIKLTAWYLLIIMSITLSFSAVMYNGVVNSTDRALRKFETGMEQRFGTVPLPPPPADFINNHPRVASLNEVKTKTLTMLVFINIFIFVVSGSLSYLLAGITLKPIENMLEKQKKFIADAAHEFKTPLTSIKTQLEVAKKSNKFNTPQSSEVADSVIEDVDSLALLTNRLLASSRYQNYNAKSNYEKFNINELIDDISNGMKERTQQHSIKINKNYGATEICIYADKPAVKELLSIILDNAIKFNKQNGEINIETFVKDSTVTVKIRDTGTGISEKDINYIFDRFYKADNARTKSGSDGFGLGLSIAKDIVNLHNGNISVTSKKDEGSEFVINLPVSSIFTETAHNIVL